MSEQITPPSADFDQRLNQQIEDTRATVHALRDVLPGDAYANLAANVNALVSGVYCLRDVVIGDGFGDKAAPAPPIRASRVRGIAQTWLRPDAPPRVVSELEALAGWLHEVAPARPTRRADVRHARITRRDD